MYYTARLKVQNECNGCRGCILACPEGNAIRLVRRGPKDAVVQVVEERCKGCELCIELCPREALETVLR
ncbi:MAG: 4Fe-4S dicluster-binding protein [Thermodesulfobacteriota bacterium]